jgi:hypothetical protein
LLFLTFALFGLSCLGRNEQALIPPVLNFDNLWIPSLAGAYVVVRDGEPKRRKETKKRKKRKKGKRNVLIVKSHQGCPASHRSGAAFTRR